MVKLFASNGEVVAEVEVPFATDLVQWHGRYFRLAVGRFVECMMVATFS